MNGDPGAKPSCGCLGDEVGRLNASCVEDIAVRPDWRASLFDEKRFVNQLIGGVRRGEGKQDGGRNGMGTNCACTLERALGKQLAN